MRDEAADRREGRRAPEAPRSGWTRTACPYCGVGCGVLAKDVGDGTAAIAGDEAHPANHGRLCVKGSHLGDTVDLDGRLLHPQIGGVRASWEAAIAAVAGAFTQAIERHGPQSVAIYASGQLLTEDYYVANKLMKGFIGAGNIDTNSRLCMASSVAGHKRGFGADVVPGIYEDLEQADLIVLVGSNLEWCHPVLAQRIAEARRRRPTMKLVNVDPRRTATSEAADLHLDLAPGSDVALFAGLLTHLEAAGFGDAGYHDAHVSGVAEALAAARAIGLAGAALATELDVETLRALLRALGGDAESGHRLQPGGQPVVLRRRQGQRHPELPSVHRADRQAGLRAVLRDRTAERHGRAGGRRPVQYVGRPYEFRRSRRC